MGGEEEHKRRNLEEAEGKGKDEVVSAADGKEKQVDEDRTDGVVSADGKLAVADGKEKQVDEDRTDGVVSADGKLAVADQESGSGFRDEENKKRGKDKQVDEDRTDGVVSADGKLAVADERSTPPCWADDLGMPTVQYNAMIKNPLYYRDKIEAGRNLLNHKLDSDDVGDKRITTQEVNLFLRYEVSTDKNTAFLVLNQLDSYVVTFKSRKIWYLFKKGEPRPISKKRTVVKKFAVRQFCPGAVQVGFKGSYPDLKKIADVNIEELEFGPNSIEDAVNGLMSDEGSKEFIVSAYRLILAFPEGIRFENVLNDMMLSLESVHVFGRLNSALVHEWATLSRIYIFRKTDAFRLVLGETFLHFVVEYVVKEIGVLKRNTEDQGTLPGMEKSARAFLENARNRESTLHAVLSSIWKDFETLLPKRTIPSVEE